MKKNSLILVILIAVILVGAFFIFYYQDANSSSSNPVLKFVAGLKGDQQMVKVKNYYTADGEIISAGVQQAVIGGVEGVKYVTLEIIVNNLDTVPLNLNVINMTPAAANAEKPTTTLTVNPKSQGSWITGLIDIEPFEGTIQDFCVNVESEELPALREKKTIGGCLSLTIDPNPEGIFDVDIDSSVGDGGINPNCTENWACTAWSNCVNSLQTRVCTDQNSCGTTADKPPIEQACQVTFSTNAVNGEYRESNVWIDFGQGVYNYGGYSAYNCAIEDTFMNTPEGYPICSRPGYTISSRVYIDNGEYGILFTP